MELRFRDLLTLYPGDLRAEKIELVWRAPQQIRLTTGSVRGRFHPLALFSGTIHLTDITVSNVSVTIPDPGAWVLDASSSLRASPRGFEVRYAGAFLRRGARALVVRRGSLEGRLVRLGGLLLEGPWRASLRSLELTPASRAFNATLEGRFHSKSADQSDSAPSLGAGPGASDGDAGAFLDIVPASSPLRWMLADLRGAPFNVAGELNLDESGLVLSGIDLRASMFRAEGTVKLERPLRGALLLHRGPLAFGVSLEGLAVNVEPSPSPGWLSAAVQRAFK